MRHHRDESLTDPYDDPESWYLARRDLAARPVAMRLILGLNRTLAGRLLLGPALSIHAILRDSLAALRAGERFTREAWLAHLAGVTIMAGFAFGIAQVPLAHYLLASYGGMSLLMIRTFAEHRAAEVPGARTAVVEAGAAFSLLFLNNNLHAVHHDNPRAPWYELPALYRRERDAVLLRNGGYRFAGYGALFRRYLLRPKEPVAHPFLRRE